MLGLRGFPGVQGGVETHAEHLCPLLDAQGCEVTVLVRPHYQPVKVGPEWRGVKFVSIWAPKSKGLETIIHSFFGVLYAAVKRPDILHIQAIGPAIMTPLARLLGLKVVVTHHGPDYDRQKWGRFAKFVLKLGEKFGMRCANARIVISKAIAELVSAKHDVDSVQIPNGVILPDLLQTTNTLDQFGLIPRKYVLLVSRLVPEKRHLDLINAFVQANLEGWRLVIVGASDHPDAYVQQVIARVSTSKHVVMTGFLKGRPLQEIYSNAGMFVLPSSHEGLPIALLEALSFGLPVIASDIPANLEVGLPANSYFPLGNIRALAAKITQKIYSTETENEIEERRVWVSNRYSWNDIAEATMAVYKSVLKN